MKLLVLLPDFGYNAAARQVALLAPAIRSLTLPARLEVSVAALGPEGPLAAPLRDAGVPVHALGTERRFDPTLAWRLRRLVAELRPEVVHAWRLPALRAAGALRLLGRTPFRLVVSEPRRGGRWNALDRWLLRRADAVLAGSSAEGDALRRLGLPTERVHALPPAVAPPPSGEPPALGFDLPPEAQLIVCVGALTPAHGFRDAIWALDILRYVAPDLHLAVVGGGPERGALVRFVRDISRAGDRVHFLGARPDAPALLARADVVWVPSRAECGRQVALEALAAGRPVVASALPGLAALVADGRTGLLTPPGDPPALARQTRRLLDDAERTARLGASARQAMSAHAPGRVVPAYAKLYQES